MVMYRSIFIAWPPFGCNVGGEFLAGWPHVTHTTIEQTISPRTKAVTVARPMLKFIKWKYPSSKGPEYDGSTAK
jgi:hypothetical protein